ncbi:hypothetical protein ACOSQ2_027563 [Xanthoceras sorbifolium]
MNSMKLRIALPFNPTQALEPLRTGFNREQSQSACKEDSNAILHRGQHASSAIPLTAKLANAWSKLREAH